MEKGKADAILSEKRRIIEVHPRESICFENLSFDLQDLADTLKDAQKTDLDTVIHTLNHICFKGSPVQVHLNHPTHDRNLLLNALPESCCDRRFICRWPVGCDPVSLGMENYRVQNLIIDDGLKNPEIFPHNDYAFLPGGAVLCQTKDEAYSKDNEGYLLDANDERIPVVKLDRAAIQRGLQVMAEKYPKHLKDFMDDQADACTGDVFLQCCMLGDVVYG